MKPHFKNTCDKTNVKCATGCGAVFPRKEAITHLETTCPNAICVKCLTNHPLVNADLYCGI
jgi:hypothetical protein